MDEAQAIIDPMLTVVGSLFEDASVIALDLHFADRTERLNRL